jgi:UDP-N-acetylmuramyl pentapeptide phosphotransferase/UDP-N-acetylglucosamine-1-phosphate transferase
VTVALGAVAGYLVARLLWVLLRPTFASPVLLRRNFRDVDVPTAAGMVLALAVLVVEGGRLIAGAAGLGAEEIDAARAAVVVVVLGMALVGLLDDLAGGDDARGFKGHLAALAAGRLTTGGVKLFGGFAVAVVAVAVAPRGADPSLARLVADAALVALAANLGNLFDRRPGRATKVGVAAFTALVVATAADDELTAVAVVAGAAAGLLLDDLRERLMLGDSGANALGGAVGLGVVLACGPAVRTAALVGVLALNVASEAVSFGRVIDAVPPLRAVDRWGRRP